MSAASGASRAGGAPAAAGGPELTVSREVVREVARLATLEVPEVLRIGRGGPAWRRWLRGPALTVKVRPDRIVDVRIWFIARPGADLVAATERVRATVGAAIERLLAMSPGTVTVFVDGVGG